MNDEILPWPWCSRRPRAAPRPAQTERDGAQARPAPRRSPTQRVGDAHEDAALRLLQARGAVLLARNLACRHGEIDLAMRDGAVLVFVEVRARRDARFGGAAASIGAAKQRRLAQAAAYWLPRLAARHWRGVPPAARFDVVAFESGVARWLRDAFLVAG